MRGILPFGLLLAATACLGGHSDPVSPTTVAGEYVLASVNGAPPPVIWQQSATITEELLGSALTLNGDRSCRETTLWRLTENGTTGEPFTTSQDCVFFVAGNRVVLDYVATIGRSEWVIDDRSLTLTTGGRTLVYRR